MNNVMMIHVVNVLCIKVIPVTTEQKDAMGVLVLVGLVDVYHSKSGLVTVNGTGNILCSKRDRLKSRFGRRPLRIAVFLTKMLAYFHCLLSIIAMNVMSIYNGLIIVPYVACNMYDSNDIVVRM